MKAAFIINARNKASLVGRAVKGALSQTYPCEILLSDQNSTDGTYEAMEQAVAETPMPMERGALEPPDGFKDILLTRDIVEVPRHAARLLRCPVDGVYGMRACNRHIQWLVEQTEAEWIFQCSADDYSLPDRVRLCMQAVEKNDCVGVACTMRFEAPGKPEDGAISGSPTESGYVSAGVGIWKMAYGSTIWGYRREWLLKVGLDVPCTLDVYLGYLASLDRGYYVVANPQHVHYMAADMANMGFQGKLRAAEEKGDEEEKARVNELNRFQLYELYMLTKLRQQQLYPLAKAEDQNALINMMLAQSQGWHAERVKLHERGITPGVMPT